VTAISDVTSTSKFMVFMKGPKLGEPCPKVRLSQDRMPIFPSPPPAKLGESKYDGLG
jgi:hypothetical protein